MVTCISIPVDIPKHGTLSKAAIKDIICTFAPNEWPQVNPDELVVTYQTGCTNLNCIVERPKPQLGTPAKPLKVFVKINGKLGGEINLFKHMVPSKHDEAQLCSDYNTEGHGAKLYGFFQTRDGAFGRIDEFLDARVLEPKDVEDVDIRAEIAREYAYFHSLETRLEKKPVKLYYDTLTSELAKYHKMEKLKRLAQEGGVNIDQLVDYDFVSRIKRVAEKLESIGGKKGWCMHDVQYMNVMLKNGFAKHENNVALIDFEFVFQNYRALDIGGHFLHKMFQWFDEQSQIADCRPYTEEEKRHFCNEYAKQWNERTGDSDSGAKIFMESELGIMLSITFEIHNMLCYMDQANDKNPLSSLALNKLFEEFVSQYKKLGLER